MDAIEKHVILPARGRAAPIFAILREGEAGRIMGVYIRDGYGGLAAGERRWVRSAQDLPLIMDGGCYVVTAFYIPGKMKAPKAQCNGYG